MKSALFPAAILAVSLLQALVSRHSLEQDTMRKGRIALSSGDIETPDVLKNRDNSVRSLLDGDLSTHTDLYFPSRHPEGTHIIAELGLTHLPPAANPVPLRPRALRIYQNAGYGRIHKARISLLRRRANDPDKENLIPPVEVIYRSDVMLKDEPVQEIPLPIEQAGHSSGYPQNVFLLIARIDVLELYPSSRNRVAINELEYLAETEGRIVIFTALDQHGKTPALPARMD